MGAGSILGTVLGGAAGAATGTPEGAKIGMSIGSGLGGSLDAMKSKKEADSLFPDYVSANQASFLAELNQKRRALETGADTAAALQQADMSQASTNQAIARAAGGNVSNILQGILGAQKNAGMIKNAALAQASQNQMGLNNAYQNMLNLVEQRKLELELMQSQQNRANWAASQRDAMANFNAGIGMMASGQQQGQPTSGVPGDNTSTGIPNLATPPILPMIGKSGASPEIPHGTDVTSIIPENIGIK